jgi:hypothetical protein
LQFHQHRDRATDPLNRAVEDLNEAGNVQPFAHRALTLFLSPSSPVAHWHNLLPKKSRGRLPPAFVLKDCMKLSHLA